MLSQILGSVWPVQQKIKLLSPSGVRIVDWACISLLGITGWDCFFPRTNFNHSVYFPKILGTKYSRLDQEKFVEDSL